MDNLFKPMTAEGAALSNLVSSLYSPDAAVKAEERRALAENKRMDTALKQARIDKYRADQAAAEAARKSDAETIANYFKFASGGAPQLAANQRYLDAGGIEPSVPETDDQPGIMGGYAMDKPPTFDRFAQIAQGFYGAKGLGDKNIQHAALASGEYGKQNMIADVLSKLQKPEDVSAAYAAVQGKPFYKNDSFGGTLNLYGGQQDQTGPVPTAKVAEINAQTGERNAHARLYGDQGAKYRSETLPQVTVPGATPGAPPVRVLGKDMSREAAKGAAGAPASGLSEDAVEHAAHRYVVDGTMPPNLGRGAQGEGTKVRILNRAAEIAAANGQDGAAARITQLAGRAGSGALLQLTKQEQMVGAFEKNALRNADVALQASAAVDRTGVPVLNRWILAGMKNIAGDPDVSRFHAATTTFVNEYAKIMSGSMGNTAVSDSLRRETESLLATKDTPEQFAATIDLMKQEMRNRMLGFAEQKAELTRGLGGGASAPTAPAPAATAAPSGPKRFNSEAEAVAAEAAGTLKKGDRIIIGNTPGTWQ